jgi:Cu2+-exporting ATPase
VFDVVVSLLVVSCPCALGLATPSALAIARARAARRGILVRSPAAIEQLARVDHLVLDKTGTVTHGRMSVAWTSELDVTARRAVAGLEARSRHPIGDALRTWALDGADFELSEVTVSEIHEHPGRGIEGSVDGHHVRIGSLAWLDGRADAHADATERALAEGHTPVGIEIDGAIAGLLALGDLVREDAAAAVTQLRGAGYRLELCSGDHPRIVGTIAAQLGIESARGGASPEDKADLVAGRPNVAMIGDGINDAPALRAAGMGVAVGGGAEAAMEVADVYLARPGVQAVVELLAGSRRTLGLVRRNLAFSLVYNVTFASLALAGLISPLAAAILMPISSLTVLSSSMLGRSFDASRRTARPRETPPTTHPQNFPRRGAVTAASTR